MPSNPILPGFNPDPSICRVGDDYFIAVSSFEYFPGIPLYHSRDLINWTLIGHALNRRSQLDMRTVDPGAGVWAPTLRYWKGRFYMATCTVFWRDRKPIQPRGFYVSTDNIFDDKSWSDPVYFDMIGIDQDLFFDDDDRVYLCVSRFSRGARQPAGTKLITYGCEIDLATGNSLSPTIPLRVSTARGPAKGMVAEGPHIYKYAGWYYLVTADGGTGPRHQVWIMRSRSPLGPYEEAPDEVNPLVHNGPDPNVQRTGHADLVQAPDGKWWMVMLGVRQQETALAQLGRETFLAPVEWPQGGWPKVNAGKVISTAIPADLPDRSTGLSWRDDFTSSMSGELELGWYNLRTPIKPCHSLTSRPGYLTLVSNGIKFDQLESPAMVLRKQVSYSGTWSTRIDFEPTNEYETAGTVAYYSDASYAAIVIKQIGDKRVVQARWTAHDSRTIEEITHELPPTGPVDLLVQAESTTYTLLYKPASSLKPPVALVTVSSLTLDGGSPAEYEFYFTGSHFGLFNQTTDGDNCLCPAYFEWAQYEDGKVDYPTAGTVKANGKAVPIAAGHTNGHSRTNGHTNGYVHGLSNGHSNGPHVNGNGHAGGHALSNGVNGH